MSINVSWKLEILIQTLELLFMLRVQNPEEKVRNSESNTAPKLAKMPSKKKRRRPESERPTIHPRNKYSETRPDFALLASLYPSFEPFVFYSHDGGRPRIDWTDFNATRELTRVLLLHDHALNWYYFTCSFLLYMHLGAHISLKVCVFLWENWVYVSGCFFFGRVFMLELDFFFFFFICFWVLKFHWKFVFLFERIEFVFLDVFFM